MEIKVCKDNVKRVAIGGRAFGMEKTEERLGNLLSNANIHGEFIGNAAVGFLNALVDDGVAVRVDDFSYRFICLSAVQVFMMKLRKENQAF